LEIAATIAASLPSQIGVIYHLYRQDGIIDPQTGIVLQRLCQHLRKYDCADLALSGSGLIGAISCPQP
jgi:hypothetical protein